MYAAMSSGSEWSEGSWAYWRMLKVLRDDAVETFNAGTFCQYYPSTVHP